MTTSIPLLMQFMSSARPKFYDFECCTFDHSDNSPCLFSSGFLSRNLLKNSLERKRERRQKIFDFEIFCVEEYQGESGGRNSQLLPKFRVRPVMTTSITLRIRFIELNKELIYFTKRTYLCQMIYSNILIYCNQ